MKALYQIFKSTFVFCEIFSETENISISKWFIKFEHEILEYEVNNLISSDKYFLSLNMLLTDETAKWFESFFDAIRLLNDLSLTQNTMNAFKFLFCDSFSSRIVEIVSVFIDVELVKLKQKSDEILISYYKRMTSFMQGIDVCDCSHISEFILLSLESIMLDTTLRAFIRELIDSEIRRESTRDMISRDRFLKTIY
jgi:hypothetical protein